MSGHGDDFMWDGLACPPLEDNAFDFLADITSSTLLDDLLLDDLLLDDNLLLDAQENEEDMIAKCFDEDQEPDKMVAVCMEDTQTPPRKATVGTHRAYGKGKVLKIIAQVLPFEKHSKTSFYYQTNKPEDRSRLERTHHVVLEDNSTKPEGLVSAKSVQGKPNYHPRRCGNFGKGKELKTVIQAMNLNEEQVKAILGEAEVVVDNRDKKRKHIDGYGTQPMQRKQMTRMDDTKQVAVSNKRKADNNCQPMQRKDIEHTSRCVVGEKRKFDDDNFKPMQQKNITRMDQTNQTIVVENKRISDQYESKFEASRQMLREAYKQTEQAKQQRHIQVIDFQPEKQQPGSKGKAKGKSSLRQRVMAMGTRKCSKKFPPYEVLSSCN